MRLPQFIKSGNLDYQTDRVVNYYMCSSYLLSTYPFGM